MTPRQVRFALIATGVLLAVIFFGGAECAARRRASAEQTVHVADSTAKAEQAGAVAANARANAEHVRAEREKARGDSLTIIARTAGRTVIARVDRAGDARAAIDAPTFATLPATVQRALEEGDSLRLAVTPMIAQYESAIAAHVATEARLELTIAKKDSAIVHFEASLAQKDTAMHALEQMRAPRCGWRCGAVLGVVSTLLVSRGGDLLTFAARLRP